MYSNLDINKSRITLFLIVGQNIGNDMVKIFLLISLEH